MTTSNTTPIGGEFEKGHSTDDNVTVAPPHQPTDEKHDHHQVIGKSEETDSSSDSAVSVESTPKRTWRSLLWDTFDRSPEERRFLFKLDAVILTFASLGYFIKYLDQVNISNAYVSGMKEDLGLYGNQLNIMTTTWTVGYVIGEIPR